MFHAISWQGYWTALALFAAAYYCLVLLTYYRQEIMARFSPKNLSAAEAMPARFFPEEVTGNSPSASALGSEMDFQLPPHHTEERVVYDCMDELAAFFEGSRSQKCTKPELISALQKILLKYPSLKGSEYRETLGQIIRTQCEQYCSIHLKAEDMGCLWLDR